VAARSAPARSARSRAGQVVAAAAEAVVGEHRHHLGRPPGADERCAVQQGAGQPRVRAHGGQGPSARGGRALPVDGAEVVQHRARGLHRRGRRRVEQRQAATARRSPAGELEREGGEVGGGDLGCAWAGRRSWSAADQQR
jgi:hypothetical protein